MQSYGFVGGTMDHRYQAYTFAELLRLFFERSREEQINQNLLAQKVGVAVPTLSNWFNGKYTPRFKDQVLRLAQALGLTALEADLLLCSVKNAWNTYGTPHDVLQKYTIVRYREELLSSRHSASTDDISLATVQATWQLYFYDLFVGNNQHWGLGYKDDGVCRVERAITDGAYQLTLHNRFHNDVFIGGDSHCFAPPIYYLSVYAKRCSGGSENDGFALIFEEMSDASHAIFRIRDQPQLASVISTRNGGDSFQIHLDRKQVATIRPGEINQLGMLVIHNQHRFFVNNIWIGSAEIERIPHSRLDVGIISQSMVPVVCTFQDFRVYIPPNIYEQPEILA